MTARGLIGRRKRAAASRVGLFGLLGAGNIGNDASMDAVLGYLRKDHPDAVLDAMGPGPESLTANYGIQASPLYWHHPREQQASGLTAVALKLLGKGVDAVRMASWVRRHDAIIVPGMGVLEATLPVRAWETPYAMFLLSASGRLFGTKVALVSVGANVINARATRRVSNAAARFAFYRSYRDRGSWDAMRQRGVDVSRDPVYPDLVYAIPSPPYDPGDPQSVGLGVMDYHGTDDDRDQADKIHAAYVGTIKRFARWLVDHDRKIRLFVGDTCDLAVVAEIQDDIRAHRPDLGPEWVVADEVTSFADLTRAMAPVSVVVATRFHNVMCSLKHAKPTISLGYAAKNITIMNEAGLGEFCQSANSLDFDRLVDQFTEIEARAEQVRTTIRERNAANAAKLGEQFAELNTLLFPTTGANGGGSVRSALPARVGNSPG